MFISSNQCFISSNFSVTEQWQGDPLAVQYCRTFLCFLYELLEFFFCVIVQFLIFIFFLFSGQAFAQKNNEITFVKKKTCTDVDLSPGEQYLIMGKEALKISIGYSFK